VLRLGEIRSASDAADHSTLDHLDIGLAEKIQAHRRVDCHKARERQQSRDGMRVIAARDREVVPIREPGIEFLRPEIDAGGVPEGGVEAAALGEMARAVRKHARKELQSLSVGDQPHQPVRHLAEAELEGRAVTGEGGDVLRDRGRLLGGASMSYCATAHPLRQFLRNCITATTWNDAWPGGANLPRQAPVR
jgi:hypothetical protein